MTTETQRPLAEEPAGYTVKDFAARAAVSMGFIYKMPPSERPHGVKVGSRLVITEKPDAWLRRVGKESA